MLLKQILDSVFEGQALSRAMGVALMDGIAQKNINNSQLAALLGALRATVLSPDFILGVREATLRLAIPVALESQSFIDVCGTGGDAKDTFNISTGTAIVLAACGVGVVKHGNYAVSSKCGSSNVLEALGYKFPSNADAARRQFDHCGITFLHAPLFHPVFKEVAFVRKELGFRTFFNILGPLVNPALPTHQLIGVSDYSLQCFLKQVLSCTKLEFSLVHSLDGYDEISLTADFKVISTRTEELKDPRDIGLARLNAEQLLGASSPELNAVLLRRILAGEGTEAQTSVLAVNAAAGLRLLTQDLAWEDALSRAFEAIRTGSALRVLTSILD